VTNGTAANVASPGGASPSIAEYAKAAALSHAATSSAMNSPATSCDVSFVLIERSCSMVIASAYFHAIGFMTWYSAVVPFTLRSVVD